MTVHMLNAWTDDVDPNDYETEAEEEYYNGLRAGDCPQNCADNCATCILGGALECEEDYPLDEDEEDDSCECDDCDRDAGACKYCKFADGMRSFPQYDTWEEWEGLN